MSPNSHNTWTIHRLEWNALQLDILPGVGGRLWDVVVDGQSLLFQNADLIGRVFALDALEALPSRSPQFGFPLWGGEKTWIAPDTHWVEGAPFPALDAGAYAVRTSHTKEIRLESPVCPLSHLQICRHIKLTSPVSWSIEHTVQNCGNSERQIGIWSVMMLDRRTVIGIPASAPRWDKVFGTPDAHVTPKPSGLVIRCESANEFKLATPNPTGRVLLRVGRAARWLLCETAVPRNQDSFAHRLPFEIFNSGDYDYCEAEWHAPTALLEPGQTSRFFQSFHVLEQTSDTASNALTETELDLITCMS
jgi:hypothetical protein